METITKNAQNGQVAKNAEYQTPTSIRGVSDTSQSSKIPLKNRVKIDYFAVTFHDFSVSEICTAIGVSRDQWIETKSHVRGYDVGISFGHMRLVWSTSRTDMGVHLQLSGKGVDEFASIHNDDGTFLAFLRGLADIATLSRIDIAYDDVSGLLTPERFRKAELSNTLVSRMSGSTEWKEQKRAGRVGSMFTMGNRQSECYLRVYDKAAEQKVDGTWTRFELEFKGQQADWALSHLVSGDVGQRFAEIVQGKMRVVSAVRNDSNRARRRSARWWSRFVGDVEKAVFHADKVERSVERSARHIHYQAERNIALVAEAIDRGYFGPDYDVSRWFSELIEGGRKRFSREDFALLESVQVASPGDWSISEVMEQKYFHESFFRYLR